MLFMVVEHYKDNDPTPVYQRFAERGRLMPEGVSYVSSWVDEGLGRCFQLMEAGHRGQLDEWMARWSDLAEFEVYAVISSEEAAARVRAQGTR